MNLAEKSNTGMMTRCWCPGLGLNLKNVSKCVPKRSGSICLKESRDRPTLDACYLGKSDTCTA